MVICENCTAMPLAHPSAKDVELVQLLFVFSIPANSTKDTF